MKIHVLGAGSVGLGIAATLVKAGADVTLLARGASLRAIKADGIHVTGVVGDHVIPPRDIRVEDVSAPKLDVDIIIVTTKTYEVAPALKTLLPALSANPKSPAIVLLQNGWGSADEAKKIVPPGTALFSGSVMVGLERLSPTEVKIHAYADAVHTGSLFGDDIKILQPFFELSQRGFIPFVHDPAIESALLTKLIYNTCLNPLGALLRCPYGDLLTDEPTLGLMRHIAEEGIETLAAARGFNRFTNGEAYVRDELLAKWLPKIKLHRSSMLQDLESGRRTEILYLNGAIAEMGRAHGVPTPCNNTIIALIQASEGKKPI